MMIGVVRMNKQEIEKTIAYWKEFKSEIPGLKVTCQFPDLDLDEQEKFTDLAISALTQQLNNGWIPVSERLPEEYKRVDGNDCYSISDEVICNAYSEYETWIDYTIDGEWQTHEYYEGEKLAWQPLPEPWEGDIQ